MIRRAQANTPPKPDNDMAAKAKNSSAAVGRDMAGVDGSGADGEGPEPETGPEEGLGDVIEVL